MFINVFTRSGIPVEVLSVDGKRGAFRRKEITENICEQYRLYRVDLLRVGSRELDPELSRLHLMFPMLIGGAGFSCR